MEREGLRYDWLSEYQINFYPLNYFLISRVIFLLHIQLEKRMFPYDGRRKWRRKKNNSRLESLFLWDLAGEKTNEV